MRLALENHAAGLAAIHHTESDLREIQYALEAMRCFTDPLISAPQEHPMKRPTGPSNFLYRVRATLIIKIETDEGVAGWGETVAFPGICPLIEE